MRVALGSCLGQRNRAVLVLAFFTRERHNPVFLTLPAYSGKIDSEGFQIGSQLRRGLELDAGHSQALGRFDIGCNVINIKGFVGANFDTAQSGIVDERIGLAGTYRTGIDPGGKEGEEAIGSFHVADVDRIRIGEQSEAVALREFFNKGVLVNWIGVKSTIPDFGELLEREISAKPLI